MDITELNRIAKEVMDAENSRPIADFDGLSSDAMHNMLYFPFEQDCKIQFAKDADSSILSGSSLFLIARDLLIEISEKKRNQTHGHWQSAPEAYQRDICQGLCAPQIY